MKKILLTLLLVMVAGAALAENPQCDETRYRVLAPYAVGEPVVAIKDFKGVSIGDIKEFIVYSDKGSRDNHYIPSGWMGDIGDIKMMDAHSAAPHTGTTSIEFTYTAKKTQGQGWAGAFWQNPANNWGSKKGGFDLTGITKLTFWAKGAKGGEVIQKFMVGGIKGAYADSVQVESGPIELTQDWKQYTINLAGKDLSYLNGGFGWSTTADLNPEGCTFYLDDIKFEADPSVTPQGKEPQGMPFYVYSDRGSSANHFIPSGWMGDFGDVKYDGASKDNPYLGNTCIKIDYCSCAYQGARWAGMYWQHPANNWGNINAGFDLSKATKLTFWARGAKGGERIEEFKVGGLSGEFSDSDSASIGPIELTKDWAQYTIDLAGRNMSSIIGGFCWTANVDYNSSGFIIYLDEIKYE